MKWIRSILILLCFCLVLPQLVTAQAVGFSGALSAESAVLLSLETGQVLYEKNANDRRAIASTTKIMTALLALEHAELPSEEAVTITEEMVRVEGSSMGLLPGDVLSLTELCAGMMATSGNDAANAVALSLAATQEDFADLMNERAQQLGLSQTHFVTPSGLDDAEHYSSAYDLAKLTCTALKNEKFAEIVSSSSVSVTFQNPAKCVSYQNHNKLLSLYDGCIGVKTGYTKKAGRCLVSAAKRDGTTLVAVTLNAPDDWNDHIALLDYGFSQMETVSLGAEDFFLQVPVVGGTVEKISVRGGAGGTVSLPVNRSSALTREVFCPAFVYAPVHCGDEIGWVQFSLDGIPVYRVPLLAQQEVCLLEAEKSRWQRLFEIFNVK